MNGPTIPVRNPNDRPGRTPATHRLLRALVVLLVLGGLLATGIRSASIAAQGDSLAEIQIRVHSCPDDLNATGFFQHLTRCTSERALYGVALGVQSGGLGASQFQYSQPDGTGQAAMMVWTGVSTGTITVTEVAPEPIRPSVVFCSLRPGENGPPVFIGTQTPEDNSGIMDGDEVPVVDGAISLDLNTGDVLICDWYRFPGGVTAGDDTDDPDGGDDDDDVTPTPEPTPEGGFGARAGDDDDDGDAANPDAGAAEGNTISIQKWVCVLGEDIVLAEDVAEAGEGEGEVIVPEPGAISEDPEGELTFLRETCSPATTGFEFSLTGDDEDVEFPDHRIGGQEAGYIGWPDLEPGEYTIAEELPDGYVDPFVFCEGSVAGRQTIRANIFELPALGAEVEYELSADETLTCEWFNLATEAPTGADTDTSITISVLSCPAESDIAAAAADGLCTEPRDGRTFNVAGPDGYQSQSDTGDSRPGAVFFGGLAPGTYTVTAAPDAAGDPAVVCEGEPTEAPDGVLELELPANTELACDWFTPGDTDDEDGDDGESHNDNIDAATNDLDNDGLIDADEAATYGTDPESDDTDGDAVGDGDEVTFFLDPLNPDTDGDGMSDGDEIYVYGTDPLNPDTDGDGVTDGAEVTGGTDPLDSDSV